MYRMDTTVVSELRRAKPHGAVVAWLRSVSGASLHLAAVTLGEIQRGIEMIRARDTAKARAIEAWADQVERTFAILSADAAVFRRHARLMQGHPASVYEDALIGATAALHDLTVVTRNVADFRAFGVSVLDPFAFRADERA
jgi:toxin FitB